MKMTHAEFKDAFDDANPVSTGSWRWGSTETYVKEIDGKHYAFTGRYHVEEGLQDEDIYGTEVRPVERTITEWVRVQQPAQVVQSAAPATA